MKALIFIFLFLTGCVLNNNNLSTCIALNNYSSFWSQQKNWKIKGYVSLTTNEKVKFIWKHNKSDNKIILINDFALVLAKFGWNPSLAWLKINKDYYTTNNLSNLLLNKFNLKLGFNDPIKLLYSPEKINNLKIIQKKCFNNYLLVSTYTLKTKHNFIYIHISDIEFD